MKVLLAPDKFKGSLTAQQVCEVIAQALQESGLPLQIIQHPLADGGEGSCDLLTQFSGGYFRHVIVRDPLFRFRESAYGVSKDGTIAFLEMAKASGLQLLKPIERNPLLTTSYGIGELVSDALDHGVQKIILGVGGSATNDGGMGMAQALGLAFYDADEKKLDPIGRSLKQLCQVNSRALHPRIRQVSFIVFCDVDNPLHGPDGAAFVFAPQKGATPEMVQELNEGLIQYEKVLNSVFHCKVNFAGAGAGGGLPATLRALTNLTIRSGVEFMMEYTGFEKAAQEADVIITGEGKMDEQTLHGKVVKGVAELAARFHKPLYAIVGKNELLPDQCRVLGIQKVSELSKDEFSVKESIENPIPLLKQRIREEIIPLLLSANRD